MRVSVKVNVKLKVMFRVKFKLGSGSGWVSEEGQSKSLVKFRHRVKINFSV